jgi:hypothetical protein
MIDDVSMAGIIPSSESVFLIRQNHSRLFIKEDKERVYKCTQKRPSLVS